LIQGDAPEVADDWKVVDGVLGATGTVDDYLIRGVTLGVLKSF